MWPHIILYIYIYDSYILYYIIYYIYVATYIDQLELRNPACYCHFYIRELLNQISVLRTTDFLILKKYYSNKLMKQYFM